MNDLKDITTEDVKGITYASITSFEKTIYKNRLFSKNIVH